MEKRYEIWVGGEQIGDFTFDEIETNTSARKWTGLIEIYFAGKYRPLAEAFPHLASGKSAAGTKESKDGTADGDDHFVRFECVGCGTGIRIPVEVGVVSRCPRCKTQFRTLQPNSKASVFLVLPEVTRSKDSAYADSENGRSVPPSVRAALAVLGLDGSATIEQATTAYREKMKEYHPDRVAHLGSELRQLAERKAKEFNEAFQKVKSHFSG